MCASSCGTASRRSTSRSLALSPSASAAGAQSAASFTKNLSFAFLSSPCSSIFRPFILIYFSISPFLSQNKEKRSFG
jgi:hypothetical protein